MRDIDDYTINYLRESFEDYQVMFRRKKVIEILGKYRHSSILEIGCGMEPMFVFLGGEFESYCFIEPSSQFYENAIRLAADDKRILGVNALFDADIYFTVNKKVKEIDFILCSSLLHEVEDPGSLLEEISRICGPETMLHINVPNAKSIHRLIAYEMGIIGEVKELSQRNRAFQQTTVFDMMALKELVSSHGFDVVEEGSYFVKPFTHDQMFSIIEKGIIDIDVLDGLYKISKYLSDFGSEIYVNCRMKR